MTDYLLSEQHILWAEVLFEDLQKWTSPYINFSKNHSKLYNDKLGVFSELLQYTNIFLYDNQKALDVFPQGIITENIILFPHYLESTKVAIANQKDKKNHIDYSGIHFVSKLTNLIEQKYHLSFTQEEHLSILEHCFTYTNENNMTIGKNELHQALIEYQKLNQNNHPQYVSNNDLVTFCQDIGVNQYTQEFFKNSGSNNTYIDDILRNSKEVNNDNHPFSKLKALIAPKQEVNENLTLEDFTKLYNNYENPQNRKNCIEGLLKTNETLLNKYDNLNDYIKSLNDFIIPGALSLNDNDFINFFNKYKEQINYIKKDYTMTTQQEVSVAFRENVATEFCHYKTPDLYITAHKRDDLINIITDSNSFYTVSSPFAGKTKLFTNDDLLQTFNNNLSKPLTNDNNDSRKLKMK